MSKDGVVDETDLKILKLLRQNARLSYREIGKQIQVSTGTVSDRVKQMQRDGIIKGFVTAVAPEKLGYHVTMLVELNVGREKKMEEFEASIREFTEACCIQYVTGDIDMMVMVRCLNQDHATETLDNIRTMDGVEMVRTHMVLKSCTLCGQCGCDCAWEPPFLQKF